MKMIKLLVSIVFIGSTLFANEDIIVYKVDNSAGKITPQTIEAVLAEVGYSVEENRDMNGPFKKQFEKTTFDTYNLMTLYYPDITMELVLKNALSGVFNPMSVGIYQKTGDKFLHVAFLSAKGMSKIVGGEADLFAKLEKVNRQSFTKAMPGSVEEKLAYEPQETKEKLLTQVLVEIDDDEADENKEEVEMLIEDGLKPIGFVMASFNEYGQDLEKAKKDDYIFYDTYSLCKLKVIYNVAITHPEAGAFAPCTLAFYHKKGAENSVLVFPNVYNWMSTLGLKDKKLEEILAKAQKDMEVLLNSTNE